MSPIIAVLYFLPGIDSTTLGGVVFSLNEDSSVDEDSSSLMTSLG